MASAFGPFQPAEGGAALPAAPPLTLALPPFLVRVVGGLGVPVFERLSAK